MEVLDLHKSYAETDVFKMVRALAQGGRTLLLVTPDRAFAREESSQVQFLHQSTIGEVGSFEQVFSSPRSARCRQWVAAMGRPRLEAQAATLAGSPSLQE